MTLYEWVHDLFMTNDQPFSLWVRIYFGNFFRFFWGFFFVFRPGQQNVVFYSIFSRN